ncbi:MAG: prepilin-type N-terminal cleavage/methylation domain-containing protein [Fimbriimonadaceae bacterium]|nr:prepilin-type N-terminal cleavage/methylation domain-containing protein [Fimbriimonadaceae bacterium]
MRYAASRRQRAFTLIELLVVIGIVLVVAAIVFPVVASARASGRKATCLSSMRQLAQAFSLYKGDDDLWHVPTVMLHAWLDDQGLSGLHCPNYVNVPHMPYEPWANRGYAVNSCLLAPVRVSSEAEVIVLAESACVRAKDEFGIEWTYCHEDLPIPDSLMRDPLFSPVLNGTGAEPIGQFGAERHFGKGHYAFVDTHVKTLDASRISHPAHTNQCDDSFPEWVGPRNGPRYAPMSLYLGRPVSVSRRSVEH